MKRQKSKTRKQLRGKAAAKRRGKAVESAVMEAPEKESDQMEEDSPEIGGPQPVDDVIRSERAVPEADTEGAESLDEAGLPKR